MANLKIKGDFMGKRLNDLKASEKRSEMALIRMIWYIVGVTVCLVVLMCFAATQNSVKYDHLDTYRGNYSRLEKENYVGLTRSSRHRKTIHYRLFFEDGSVFSFEGPFDHTSLSKLDPGEELFVLADTVRNQKAPVVYEIRKQDGEMILSYASTVAQREQTRNKLMGMVAIPGLVMLIGTAVCFVKWKKSYMEYQKLIGKSRK